MSPPRKPAPGTLLPRVLAMVCYLGGMHVTDWLDVPRPARYGGWALGFGAGIAMWVFAARIQRRHDRALGLEDPPSIGDTPPLVWVAAAAVIVGGALPVAFGANQMTAVLVLGLTILLATALIVVAALQWQPRLAKRRDERKRRWSRPFD